MILDNYLHKYKNYLYNFIVNLDNNKVVIYIIFIFFYLLLYYIITVPELTEEIKENKFYNKIIQLSKEKWFISLILTIDILLIFTLIGFIVYYYKNKLIYNHSIKRNIILITVGLMIILIYFNIFIFSRIMINISNSIYIKNSYLTFSTIFYVIFITLFFYNINSEINTEFILSLEILLLFSLQYVIQSIGNIGKIYYLLKKNDFSELTINCFKQNNREGYSSLNNNENIQLIEISKKYGDNYLKTNGNIPISFYNKSANEYQDLVLADFYYPGSYYSYLADTPLNGTPSLSALKIGFQKFKTRFIHLDIFSDSSNEYDRNANINIRCKNMKQGAEPLNIDDVFSLINKWAWINDDPNKNSYPLFLYLNIEYNETNENLHLKLYNLIIKYFSKRLVDKKYGYSGRNNLVPVSMAKMKDCFGKIIITTNIYPTKTILDELINGSNNFLNSNFNINLYKSDYINFEKVGLSQDNDKTSIINQSKTNLNFYYTLPNEENKNNNQPKAGMYNPSFQDCAQYGIQGTLMYIFLPDENLNKWVSFFKNKNNFDPVLKDEELRLIDNKKPIIEKQNPIIGLQSPQKYCLIPGLMSTDKSNLSTKNNNNSCN
jgi:hypothetical protein